MSKLLADVEDREERGSVIIDADSLLFSACYQFRDKWNEEDAYMNFIERIGTIRTACYDRVANLDDLIIAFTSKTNFRYKIYPSYKANRKELDGDAKLLKERVTIIKKLVYSRLKHIIKVSNVWEGDDICIQYADKGYMVSAFDKDVINACPTPCFNYKKGKWNKGRTKQQIRDWYLIQTMVGDTSDGFKGAKGVGDKGATKIVDELDRGIKDFNDYIGLFDTPAECLLMNQLVRMNQYDSDGKLKLITMEEVIDEILPF